MARIIDQKMPTTVRTEARSTILWLPSVAHCWMSPCVTGIRMQRAIDNPNPAKAQLHPPPSSHRETITMHAITHTIKTGDCAANEEKMNFHWEPSDKGFISSYRDFTGGACNAENTSGR